jgi:uncharacterized protein YjbI with pentapeptide repeats
VEREQALELLQRGLDGVTEWNARRDACEPPKLDRACLRSADLCGCDFRGVRLFRADLACAKLREADFTGANIAEADLGGADLTGARITSFRVNLEGAVLVQANLEDTYLGEANLDEADLRGANLCTATGLTLFQLRKAKLDSSTRLSSSLAAEYASLPPERQQALSPAVRKCLEEMK